MIGLQELKQRIEVTATTIECPLKDCTETVERQRKSFKKEERFKCPKHNIYISPSTFEYADYRDNLLWKGGDDEALLDKISMAKRESRMARDNSEDAVTWNVFRYLEKKNLIEGFISQLTSTTQEHAEVIYWSYSQKEGHAWTLLNKAREEFGEELKRSSEPDIIIKTDNGLFFIEAKLTSGNDTPSNEKQIEEKIRNPKKYTTGGGNWFQNVFLTSYKEIVRKQKYELLRFWLLGTWMAEQTGKEFYLINLVTEEKEKDIEAVFQRHIKEKAKLKFLRLTWESIYKHISQHNTT